MAGNLNNFFSKCDIPFSECYRFSCTDFINYCLFGIALNVLSCSPIFISQIGHGIFCLRVFRDIRYCFQANSKLILKLEHYCFYSVLPNILFANNSNISRYCVPYNIVKMNYNNAFTRVDIQKN